MLINIRETEKNGKEKYGDLYVRCHCNCKICCWFVIDETLPINVFCGVVAGVVGSVISNPTDVLKVRSLSRRKFKS